MENVAKKQLKIEYIDPALYEEFYSTFYNIKFPIYFMQKKTKSEISTRFLTGFEWINKNAIGKKNAYLSICNKFLRYSKDKTAINAEYNTRSARFFVVDIDSDYIIKRKSALKFIEAFKSLGFFDYCPVPTAVIHSGCGLHFYYKIDEIYLPKTEKTKENYRKWLDDKLSLYKDTAEVIRRAIKTALSNTLPYINNLSDAEELALKSLKVDDKVIAGTQQIIRAPGSYNSNAEQFCTIIEFNKNIEYCLGELIKDYRPKTERISEKIIRYSKSGIYTPEETVKLNLKRLDDMFKLVEIRKEAGTLVGTRQNIMSNAAWLIINTNSYLEDSEKIDELEKLQELGKIIGSEFSNAAYCIKKLKHIKTYHKNRNKISNMSMIKFLDISIEELEEMQGIRQGREAARAEKRKAKEEKKSRIKERIRNNERAEEIMLQEEISRATYYRWKEEITKEINEAPAKNKSAAIIPLYSAEMRLHFDEPQNIVITKGAGDSISGENLQYNTVAEAPGGS